MNKDFQVFGAPDDNVCQEAAEVIKIIMKAHNFGWLNFHPDSPEVCNAQLCLNEIEDLEKRLALFKPILNIYISQFKQGNN